MAKFGKWVSKEEGVQVPEIKEKIREDIIHRDPVEAVLYQPERIWSVKNLKTEEIKEVTPGGMVLGSDPQADFFINNSKLSSQHARVYVADGVLFLEPLNGLKDVYIGELNVEEPASLYDQDTFRIGAEEYFKIELKEE